MKKYENTPDKTVIRIEAYACETWVFRKEREQ